MPGRVPGENTNIHDAGNRVPQPDEQGYGGGSARSSNELREQQGSTEPASGARQASQSEYIPSANEILDALGASGAPSRSIPTLGNTSIVRWQPSPYSAPATMSPQTQERQSYKDELDVRLDPNFEKRAVKPISQVNDSIWFSDDTESGRRRNEKIMDQIDYFEYLGDRQAVSKQFRKENNPNISENSSENKKSKSSTSTTRKKESNIDTDERTFYVAPDGAVNVNNTATSTDNKKAKDSSRPKRVIPIPPNIDLSRALPGWRDQFPYWGTFNSDLSQDENIDRAINEQSEIADYTEHFPNAAEVEDFGYSSREEYDQDWQEGRREFGRYGADSSAMMKMRESVARLVNWVKRYYVPLESQHMDEDGRIRFDAATETAINNYMNYMGYAPQERYLVFHQVMKSIGYSPDRNGLFLRQEQNKVPDKLFIEALNNMMLSCEIYGHPYGYVNQSMVYGGTRCFPVGVMTLNEAKALCAEGHIFEGQDPWELMSKTASTWVNETLPAIRKNVFDNDGGAAQMMVIEDLVRALCSLDGITPRIYHVSETIDRGYEEMMDELRPNSRLVETEEDREVQDERRRRFLVAKQRRDRAAYRTDKKRNRTRRVYNEAFTGEDGKSHLKGERVKRGDNTTGADIKEIRNSEVNQFDSFCMSVANMAKFAGVVGYIPIMGSAALEHAQGNLSTKVVNNILFSNDPTFKPTDAMYAYVTSDEGREGISAWKTLLDIGGQEAVTLFYQNMGKGSALTKENVRKFLDEFINRHKDPKTALGRKAQQWSVKMDDVVRYLMPGDIGFGKADARRWLEGFMINNRFNAKDEAGLEQAFTAEEVLEMMDSMGISRFLSAVTDMNAGRDAMLMVRNQTLNRKSPLTHLCDVILKSNGITNMAVTLGIDTYFTYGIALIENFIPFSNTFSYLAVKGINRAATGGRNKIGIEELNLQNQVGSNNVGKQDLNILNYQMGGMDAFGAGLWKNFMYDIGKLGNICLITAFTAALVAALGFEEPEDESLKYVWSEYRIGKNIALGGVDENGEPHGIPVYFAWWLNDLTLFGLPAAYAINAKGLDQTLVEDDPMLSTKLFFNGCYSMLSGASLLDMCKVINNVSNDLQTYERMMEDPEVDCPPDWFSFSLMQAELFAARGVNKFVPNMIKGLRTDTAIIGPDKFDRDPTKVYDRTSDTPGKTKYVTDWFELQRRHESKYNFIYALYNNLTKNGYLFDDGTTQNTGYLLEEMPFATSTDQLQMSYAEKFHYDPSSVPEENRLAYKDSKVEEVIYELSKFGNPLEPETAAKAAANGFMIPADLRIEMNRYCYRHINAAENLYNNGKQISFDEMQNQKSIYKSILNEVVWNKNIPWSADRYVKLITSHQAVYFHKDSGKPATEFDYWSLGPEEIAVKYIPRGDHPTMFSPITTPDRRNRGYDYETKSAWYDEDLTDTNLIFNNMQNVVVPAGRDTGMYTNNAIFGGQPTFTTNEPIASNEYKAINEPTMNYRAYVPFEEEFLVDLPNIRMWGDGGSGSTNTTSDSGNSSSSNNSGSTNKSNNGSSSNASKSTGNDTGANNGQDVADYLQPYFDDYTSGAANSILNSNSGNSGNTSSGSSDGSGGTDTTTSGNGRGWTDFISYLKSMKREDMDGDSSLGDIGKYYPKEYWQNNSYPSWNRQSWPRNGKRYYSKSYSNDYAPRIYSNPRSVNNDRAATMYTKQPYNATITSYLRPGFDTKGSREAYKRQDI